MKKKRSADTEQLMVEGCTPDSATHGHVFEHALTQRTNRPLNRLGRHRVWSRG
ncbi:hypothetical protein [Ktedonobacter sp. SOSP1-85]|uniref:hypothetical protein n=1 Tax=Ktedonobacter sp. SOSP1-85 TaxID=2778367 RepID=UPI001916164C|nr:hypothetical protein [Ktedonobacter sp. SOSP1-85]